MSDLRPFHLAVPVLDIAEARSFYGDLMGCGEARSSSHWVDFDFFGDDSQVFAKDASS